MDIASSPGPSQFFNEKVGEPGDEATMDTWIAMLLYDTNTSMYTQLSLRVCHYFSLDLVLAAIGVQDRVLLFHMNNPGVPSTSLYCTLADLGITYTLLIGRILIQCQHQSQHWHSVGGLGDQVEIYDGQNWGQKHTSSFSWPLQESSLLHLQLHNGRSLVNYSTWTRLRGRF